MHENEPIKKMVVTTNIFTGIHKPPTSLHNLYLKPLLRSRSGFCLDLLSLKTSTCTIKRPQLAQ